jgi:hypothetical protein
VERITLRNHGIDGSLVQVNAFAFSPFTMQWPAFVIAIVIKLMLVEAKEESS